MEAFNQTVVIENSYDTLLDTLIKELQPGDQVVIMSNGSFGGLPQKLLERLEAS